MNDKSVKRAESLLSITSSILIGVGCVVTYASIGRGLVVLLGILMILFGGIVFVPVVSKSKVFISFIILVQALLGLVILVSTALTSMHLFNILWSGFVFIAALYVLYLRSYG